MSPVPRNTAWLFLGGIAGQGLGVVTTVLLASRLGLTGFGEYAFVSAVVFVANVATTFGTDMILIRDIAGVGRRDRWVAALVIQLGLSGLCIGLIGLAAPLLPGQHEGIPAAARILSLTLLPSALFSVGTAVLRGTGMMRVYVGAGAIAAAVPLGAVTALVTPGASIVRVAAVMLIAQVVVALAVWTVCAIRVPALRGLPRVSSAEVADMARASAPIGVLGLLGMVYQRAGAISLGLFSGPAATGWFAGAFRIVDASKTGHVALFGAVYPAMAAAHARQSSRSEGRGGPDLGRSAWLCAALGGVVSVVLLLAGPIAIDRLYGPAFGPAKTGLAILALTVVPSTVATYQSLALVGAHRERDTLRVLALSLGVLLITMGTLIPMAGWIGACWATLLADTTQAALMLIARSGFRRVMAPDRVAPPRPVRVRGQHG